LFPNEKGFVASVSIAVSIQNYHRVYCDEKTLIWSLELNDVLEARLPACSGNAWQKFFACRTSVSVEPFCELSVSPKSP